MAKDSTISPTALKLAERYGIAPDVMEQIIRDTRAEALGKQIPAMNAPPATRLNVPHPPGEVPNSWWEQHTIVEEPKPVAPVIVEKNSETVERKSDGVPLAAVALGIIGVLALIAVVFYFGKFPQGSKNESRVQTASIDTPPPAPPPPAPLDTMATPPKIASPGEPSATPAKMTAKHKVTTRKAHASQPYVSSSSLSAEERLAELRADGDNSSQIVPVTKHGVTQYKIVKRRRRH